MRNRRFKMVGLSHSKRITKCALLRHILNVQTVANNLVFGVTNYSLIKRINNNCQFCALVLFSIISSERDSRVANLKTF